jgi:hypothetical protein
MIPVYTPVVSYESAKWLTLSSFIPVATHNAEAVVLCRRRESTGVVEFRSVAMELSVAELEITEYCLGRRSLQRILRIDLELLNCDGITERWEASTGAHIRNKDHSQNGCPAN